MTHNPNRVFSIHDAELQAAMKKLISLSEQGLLTEEFLRTFDENKYPEVAEYKYLAYLLLLNNFQSSVLNALKKIEASFTDKWQKELLALSSFPPDKQFSKGQKLREKLLSDLRKDISQKLASIPDRDLLEKEILSRSEKIQVVEDLPDFFKAVFDCIQKHLEELSIDSTLLEENRGLLFDNLTISNNSQGSRQEKISNFETKLADKKVHPALIHFALKNLNQPKHMKAYYILQELLDRVITEDEDPSAEKKELTLLDLVKGEERTSTSVADQHTNITIESPTSLLITYVKDIAEFKVKGVSKKEGIPSDIEARCYFQYRIKIDENNPNNITDEDFQVELIDTYLDIYNPVVRQFFFTQQANLAIDKIRRNQPISASDKKAIETLNQNYKLPNGELNPERLNDLTDKTVFQILWNNLQDAENLLLTRNIPPQGFFGRPVGLISADLKIIKNHHHYSDQVVGEINSYLEILQMVERKDLAAIKREFKQGDASKMQQCLHSVRDVRFIKALINDSTIKNSLNNSVLTHFALQDQNIAARLLKPTFFETVTFRIKALFNLNKPNEKLCCDRFTSADLKKIVTAYPSFWSSFFAKTKKSIFNFTPNFRDRLEGKELTEMIDLKNERNTAFYRAIDNVYCDQALFDRASKVSKITPDKTANFIEENPLVTLERFATDAKGKKWQQIHEGLKDKTKIAKLYKAKLEQEYNSLETDLVVALEDLWGTRINGTTSIWTKKIAELPDNHEIMKQQLISVVGDKTINVKRSLLTKKDGFKSKTKGFKLPKDIMIAELFITQPFKDGFDIKNFLKQKPTDPNWLHKLQKALLNNSTTFNALFKEPEFKNVEPLSDFIVKDMDTFLNIFQYPPLKELCKLSPSLSLGLKKVFDTSAIKELAQNDYRLATLIRELTTANTDLRKRTEAHTIVKDLLNDKAFVNLVQQLPGVHKHLEKLLTNARFKMCLKQEPDLFLFSCVWKICKREKNVSGLLELSTLLSEKQLHIWLDSNQVERNYVINNIITDKTFQTEFCKHQSFEIKDLLLRKANAKQLTSLILNCPEFAKRYLESLENYTQVKGGENLKENFFAFVSQLDPMDLALVITKYPSILEHIEAAGFFRHFEGAIKTALIEANTLIADEDLQIIKNINQTTNNLINYLRTEENKFKYSNELDPLYKTKTKHPAEIGKFLVKQLNSEKYEKKLIEVILNSAELMNAFFAEAANDIRVVPALIEQIAVLLERKENALLKKFTNNLLMKATLDKDFKSAIKNNKQTSEYFNRIANPLLLAKYLTQEELDLQYWFEGLNRIAEEKQITPYIPALINYKNFGRWLFKKCGQKNNVIGLSILKHVPNEKIIELLNDGQFESKDLASWILNSRSSDADVIDIRTALLTNQQALNKFISNAYRQSNLMIEIACRELDIYLSDLKNYLDNPQKEPGVEQIDRFEGPRISKLGEMILSEPYLNHLFETASNEDLEKLLLSLLEKGQRPSQVTESKFKEVANKLIHIFCERPDIRSKLLNSKVIMEMCLEYVIVHNKNVSPKELLLNSLAEKKLPESIQQLTDAHYKEYLELFIKNDNPASGNQLIQLLLEGLRHWEKHPRGITNMVIEILNSQEMFKLMFSENNHPHLQQQLLIKLMKLARGGENKDASHDISHYSQTVRKRLKEICLTERPSLLDKMIRDTGANELVTLYLEDGVDLQVEEKNLEKRFSRRSITPAQIAEKKPTYTYYFRDFFKKGWVLDKLFLFSDDKTLLKMFKAQPEFSKLFVLNAQQDSMLGVELRKRLAFCKLSDDQSLMAFSIRHLQNDFAELQNLMITYPEIYDAYLMELEKDSSLFASAGEVNETFIKHIINYGSAADLVRVLNAVKAPNPVSAYLFSILREAKTNPATHEALVTKLLSHFGTLDEPAHNLIQVMFKNLSVTEISKLLQDYPKLNEVFIKYFEQNPKEFESKFKNNEEVLKDFFMNAKYQDPENGKYQHQVNLYLLLNEKLQNSSLTTFIDTVFQDDDVALPLLLKATSVQLARIFNAEGLSNKETHPLSVHIFGKKKLLKNMFKAVSVIEERLAFCKPIRDALEYNSREDDITVTDAYYDNFKTRDNPCLKFINAPDKPVSQVHYEAFLFLLYQKLNYDIVNKRSFEEIYQYYYIYIRSVNLITEFDEKGKFYFQNTDYEVPLEHAVSYYLALSRFFYADPSIQDALDRRPEMCKALIQTLEVNEGYPFFKIGVVGKAPAFYMHMVLYAYCQLPNAINNLTPEWVTLFVTSINYIDGKFIFAGTESNEKPQKPRVVPPKYMEVVTACLQEVAQSGEVITNSAKLLKLCGLSNLVGLALQDEQLAANLINSLYIDEKNIIRFLDNKIRAPQFYVDKVFEIIKAKYQTAVDLDFHTLCLVSQMPQRDLHFNTYIDNFVDRLTEASSSKVFTEHLTKLLQLPVMNELVKNNGFVEFIVTYLKKLDKTHLKEQLLKISELPAINEFLKNSQFCNLIAGNVGAYTDGTFRFKLNDNGDYSPDPLPLNFYTTIQKVFFQTGRMSQFLGQYPKFDAVFENALLHNKQRQQQSTENQKAKAEPILPKPDSKLITQGTNGYNYPDYVRDYRTFFPWARQQRSQDASSRDHRKGLERIENMYGSMVPSSNGQSKG